MPRLQASRTSPSGPAATLWTGDGHDNALLGGGGNDILERERLGNDCMTGGAGNDTVSFTGDIDQMFDQSLAGTYPSRRRPVGH